MADGPAQKPASVRMTGLPGPGGGGGGQGRTIERAKDTKVALHRLMHYLRPYRTTLILVGLFAVLGTALALSGPFLMGRAIDQLVKANRAALFRLILFMLGAYVFSAAAQLTQGVLIAGMAQKAMRALRADLFNHLQKLSLRFFDSRIQGDLMSRLTNDMDAINQVLTHNAAQLFTGLLTIVGILAIIIVLSPWLALGSMIAFPPDDRSRRYGRPQDARGLPQLPGATGRP